jgi:hypothetical protein
LVKICFMKKYILLTLFSVLSICVSLGQGCAEFFYSQSEYCSSDFNSYPEISGGTLMNVFEKYSDEGINFDPSTGEIYIYASIPGTYTLVAQIETDQCGIEDIEFVITINESPNLELLNDIYSYCEGDSILLSVYADPNASIFWDFNGIILSTSEYLMISNASIDNVGDYIVTASLGGCENYQQFFIEVTTILISQTTTNATCQTCSDGSISVSVSGGAQPYTYLWSGPNGFSTNIQNIINLLPGSYQLTVTDTFGCNSVKSVVVSFDNNCNISASVTSANATCSGICDGAASVSPIGGAAPFTYSWSNGSTSPSISNLCAGVYFVTITDTLNCTAQDSVIISESSTILISPTTTNATCQTCSDGSISVSVSGGAQPYTFLWSGPTGFSTNIQNIINLLPGSYQLTVTDTFGCNSVKSVVVSFDNNCNISASVTSANATCSGICDGAASVSPIGGAAPFTYSWSNGSTSPSISNLCAGVYFVTITDTLNCTAQDSVIISESQTITLSVSSADATCFNSATGSATVTATGGAGGYSYVWNTTPPQNTPTAIGLKAGTYLVTVTDSSACDAVAEVTIGQPTDISIFINRTNTSCETCTDGSIAVALNGGFGPYTYAWSNGDTTSTLNGLSVGSYTVMVTDANGCLRSSAVNISVICNLVADVPPVIYLDCAEKCNGVIELGITGGIPPYDITWNNGRTGPYLESLCVGTYVATIIDALGCKTTYSQTFLELPGTTLEVYTTPSECKKSKGTAIVEASGLGPFTYLWTNGIKTEKAENLAAGIYMVTVTDSKGCNSFAIATISDINAPNVSMASITDNSCFGQENGAININVSGGAQPYTYLWSNGETTRNISNLPSGPYEVRVMGGDSCVAMRSYMVDSPNKIEIQEAVTEASCGVADGAVITTVSGGSGNYTYSWSTGQTTSGLSAVPAGIYTLTVTDNTNCQRSKNIAVGEQGGPQISITSIIGSTCNQANGSAFIEVTGGTPGYSYNWSNGSASEELVDVEAGVYHLFVKDQGGCKDFESIEIPAGVPSMVSACILVTVDTLTGMNQIIWEKDESVDIAYYNIYRESSVPNIFFKIASFNSDSLSVFTDSVANPATRSWRYKIGAVDLCGNESEHSLRHKTIHLSINRGLNGAYNLIWDKYEGFEFSNFYIYRMADGNEQLLDSLPGNETSYTDLNPPAGDVFYQIEVMHPEGCEATRAVNHNSARSNRSTATAPGGEDVSVIENAAGISVLNVYPNPVKNKLNIAARIEAGLSAHIYLMDLHGRACFQEQVKSETGLISVTYDTTSLAPGVYFVRMVTDKGIMNKKVVIAH